MNKKSIVVAVLAATVYSFAETSAFNAGNLNAESPYGLTDNEKELLKNKRNVATIQDNLSSVSENIQGLQSVIDGMNARIARLEQRINELEIKINSDDSNSSGETVESLKKKIDETRIIQTSNYEKITKTLNQLATLIDKKHTNTVTPSKQNSRNQSNNNEAKLDFSKKDNKTIISNAIALFNKNNSEEAKVHFEYLISKKYQPAISNYHLGEIAYKQKKYSEAIKYYQKSIELSDNGSYIPKLLYHTAISFDKVGDTVNANKFYKALKIGYPESKEAQTSPNRN